MISGIANMPLHPGRVPAFITDRMGDMGSAVIESVIEHHGKSEALTRLSDPAWLQSLGALSGFQWNSSGLATVLLGSIRRKMNSRARETGIYFLGGKNRRAWRLPTQILRVADTHGLDGDELVRSCRLIRRVEDHAIQDGFRNYMQYFIVSDEGQWINISQGMRLDTRRARRYHTRQDSVRSFVSDPHNAIVDRKGQPILNLADSRVVDTQNNIIQMVQDGPAEVIQACRHIDFGDYHHPGKGDVDTRKLGAVLAIAHGRHIDDFESLVDLKGIGPNKLRSLALASELIFGTSASCEDPARYAFASGGKDAIGGGGPLDLEAMDSTIQHLQQSVEKSRLGFSDQSRALKNLHRATKHIEKTLAPIANIEEFENAAWKHAEQNGGYTFLGRVSRIPGLTRTIFSLGTSMLYRGQRGKRRS